ncbi:hypothetical protein YC2023_108352 [Brassica napus]
MTTGRINRVAFINQDKTTSYSRKHMESGTDADLTVIFCPETNVLSGTEFLRVTAIIFPQPRSQQTAYSPLRTMHKLCKDARITSAGLLHTDVRVCPSAHTGRPWPSVSTHRTSGCPSVHISARSVDCSGDFGPRGLSVQYTQDVRQHTQDVRGCPCVSVCPSVHTGRPSAHTGRPSAHAGCPWLSVCVCVSVSAHRTSVSTHRTSVSTRRTSVSTRRTSVAVRVCPCVRQCTQDVRQHTQDVRQHTQDVRQHTQDVRGCPCVSVCPSAHAGRPSVHTGCPSAHKGRPWPSVSTHRTSVITQRTSVAVRQHTQGVRQHTQDVRVCLCVRQYTQDVRQHTQDVRQYTQDVRQHTQDVRGRPSYTQDVRQHTQDVRACPLAHTDCPWTDPCTELISAC